MLAAVTATLDKDMRNAPVVADQAFLSAKKLLQATLSIWDGFARDEDPRLRDLWSLYIIL